MRDIAAKAGVGMGTIYRHFPTRAYLIIASQLREPQDDGPPPAQEPQRTQMPH